MQEVPKVCRLRSFEFVPDVGPSADTLPLLKVLTENWLSHLQHLGIPSKYEDYRTVKPIKASPWGLQRDSPSGDRVNPILKGLGEPGCSLTSLHLFDYDVVHGNYRYSSGCMDLEDLMMLATKLVTLRLEGMNLGFEVSRISQYAVKEKCSLKHLHLEHVKLLVEPRLAGVLPSADENKELLLGWRNVAQHLEELTIAKCKFADELFSWLNLSVPNLRTLSIGRVEKWTTRNGSEHYANQVLEALTRSGGDSIEELSLTRDFWERNEVLMLHPIREALQRCPRMRKVKLGNSNPLPESIGPGTSTPLSSSDVEALNSDNMCLALLKIVLSVPMLQTLTCELFFEYWKDIGTFRAIADKAKNWPGNRFYNGRNTLTLHGLSSENACDAMHVFRERGLEHCLRYVSDNVYELWFPV